MKKIMMITALAWTITNFEAQNTVADFESFSLTPNSVYTSTNSTPFQTSNAVFEYEWLSAFGGYWIGGFAYTNKYDSTTAAFTNLYGVKPLKGHNGSGTYVIGQDGGTIRLKSPNARVNGFFITNTTYAFKSVRNGDSFSRKFGDTTGTGSGTTIAQGSYPDFFKVTAKGYLNGSLKSDSSVFYLADYRFANNALDYVVDTWQYFNLANLGIVDSITFNMYSSDNSGSFLNTPAFFGMDDFSTSPSDPRGIVAQNRISFSEAYPNPFNQIITLLVGNEEKNLRYCLRDNVGKIVMKANLQSGLNTIDSSELASGIYYLQIITAQGIETKKLLKP